MRYKLTLRWLGTHYCGWQVQPNAPTICGAVQDAVERLFGERGELTGCSRTDSGVHAVGFVAALKCEGCRIPPEALRSQIPPPSSSTKPAPLPRRILQEAA